MNLRMTVNQKAIELEVDDQTPLLDIIRDQLTLCGTKHRCHQGICGLCTVLMNGKAVKSCKVPAFKAQNANIITIEGIGSPDHLHPLQKAFLECGAVQCGYCTPAFIVAAYGLLQQNKTPSRKEIIRAINPILCRCTGYHQIIESIEAVIRGEYKCGKPYRT
ncbi:(2Fe-2S)-binding protein [bacterium]|nr:(2Fe-2S)-binding protein [bacterium]